LFRYIQLYRRNPGPVLFGVLASIVLLLETVVSMTNADLWLASWWLHHVLLFAAFVVVVLGIALQFRRRSTLRGVLEGLLLRDSLTQVEREYTDTIIALVAAVEARDPYTHGHSANVAEISEQIGRQLGLRGEALETLHLSALLHDIGKIGISDTVLLKPGRLTSAEFSAIQEHPVRGEEIVSKIGALCLCLPGIRSHHERLDGSGYPDGLKGEEIPLFARIIAVADCYDAMTSKRPYRGPMSSERALCIIQAEASEKLDAVVVAAFVEIMQAKGVQDAASDPTVLAAD
jgi:HD-GYP domain-containing protein (c-di-GMP phosphodiesterase class II)